VFLEQPKVMTLILGFLMGVTLDMFFVFIFYLNKLSTKAFLSNN